MVENNDSGDTGLLVTLSVGQARELIREELTKALSVTSQQERLLDAKEAAEMLSVSEDWLYRNSKKLPFTRKLAPKMLRFSYQGIVKYLATRQITKN
jgi:predicted DNA-binding transcriptional regulator AlpA